MYIPNSKYNLHSLYTTVTCMFVFWDDHLILGNQLMSSFLEKMLLLVTIERNTV